MKMEFSRSRRTFIKSTAILSGLSMLLGLNVRTSAEAKQPLNQPEQSGKGYRLTEHIKKYYETARL
jgi:hypothetical protein